MADQTERIVLEVDDAKAILAAKRTNAELEKMEKQAGLAIGSLGRVVESVSEGAAKATQKSLSSIERIVRAAEQRARTAGKTVIERLQLEQETAIKRVAADPRAVDRLRSAYTTLIAEQRKAEAGGASLGDVLRRALENPRGALDSLIGGLTGLPGILAAGAVAVGGLAVGIFNIVKGMGDWAEQLQNTANATGLTREEVQLLTAAAQEQSVSADIVQQVMRGLSKTMEDTSPKAIALREEFGKMGVEFFKLKGGPEAPLPLLLSIGNALSKIEDPMKRIAKAQELFGRAGQEGLKLFNGSLDETIEKLRAAGVAIDESALRRMDLMDQRFDEAARRWDTWGKQAKTAIVNVVDAWLTLQGLFPAAPTAPAPAPVSLPLQAGAAAARARDIRLGTEVVAGFQRRREQGAAGLQTRLGRLTEERQTALGGIGTGLGEAAARTAVAEVQRLDKEIAGVQARIKEIQEAPAKAERAREKQAALHTKILETMHETAKQEHAAAIQQAQELFALERRVADARRGYQLETVAVQAQVHEQAFDQQLVMLERARDAQVRNLEGLSAKTVEEKISVEQRKLEIDVEFLKRSEELHLEKLLRQHDAEINLAYQTAQTQEDFEQRLAAIKEKWRQQELDARAQTAADVQAQTQDSTNRQTQIIRTEYDKTFDRLKDSFGGLFDAMISRSQSFASALWGIFQAVLLTPVKEAFATIVAGTLTGRTGGMGGGLGGLFGGIMGRAGGGGGSGTSGAGTTPSGTSIGPMGTIMPAAGLWAGAKGGFGGLTAAGVAPGLLGAAALGGVGAYKLGQRGGIGKVLGPALGAFSGLLGFGSLVAMFPALLAAGPAGWIVAGGIGAFIGIMGALRKSAENKAKEKIKALYGVTINEKNILQQITGIAKELYGGNLDLAIRSQPVRDLVELYNMTMAGTSLGLSKVPQPVSVMQGLGGQITTTPGTRPAVMPMASAAPITVVMPVQVVGAREFFTEETVNVIGRSGRTVQQSSLRAQRSNIGRRENAALQLAPTMITS